MKINGQNWRSIWLEEDTLSIGIIDQRKLPHCFVTTSLHTYRDVVNAINKMLVRGAPLIGVAGAYGLMLALKEDSSDLALDNAFNELISTRPTAVNLRWALNRVFEKVKKMPKGDRVFGAKNEATLIVEEDLLMCESIGNYGVEVFKRIDQNRPSKYQYKPLNILTHCNAGWLATVDWGTALSPIYKAHRQGLDVHVWVDETRPRNQGASLTAYELSNEGIPNTLIVDNAGGFLMQNKEIDVVIVGADRVTRSGDVCNKIGTYLKALAAKDNGIPFYVAMPSSTLDWALNNGISEIPIEMRSSSEVTQVSGRLISNSFKSEIVAVEILAKGTNVINPAFDITPAKLVTSCITERGIAPCSEDGFRSLFPELE